MKRLETFAFILALGIANFTLPAGRVCEPLVFFPEEVLAGEWWRVLTFPFVHVSWYHLMLDAGAFLLLYHGLQETSAVKRLGLVAACAAGSLGLSLLTVPLTNGLCGLSGIAHGLMAVSAIELMQTKDKPLQRAGLICLLIVVCKSLIEALSGHILFNSLHFGSVGNAVPICHTGGVLGGVSYYALTRPINKTSAFELESLTTI
ncbi:MAG: rhombosortase [Pontiellaceae bacterium]|jgi:rhomboid family GlyGly-CTERM serine protease|nr:rhombosortase [Pontiellaceae bacterium]